MASRLFILTAAALVVGTTALLSFGLFQESSDQSATASPATPASDQPAAALGVRAADHDPASAAVPELPSFKPRQERRAGTRVPLPELPPSQPVSTVTPLPANAASEANAAAHPKVVAAVRADLEARRDALRKACWPPNSDAGATVTMDASYAADGTLLSLGVPDVPGLPGVGTCLMGQIRQKPPVLREPPGVPLSVSVPVAFAGSELSPPPILPPVAPRPASGGR